MIIGLNGYKNAGKNLVGQYLEDAYGFQQLSFAAKLKESAAACFGIDPALWDKLKNQPDAYVCIVDDNSVVYADITVRQYLQRYGTEAHRDVFGQEFWVDALLEPLSAGIHLVTATGVEYVVGMDERLVITDARFENELTAIHRVGGINVRIDRPGLDTEDAHRSEEPPDPALIDATLVNDDTIFELLRRVDSWMEALGLGKKA